MMLRYEGLRLSLLEPSHIYPVHIRVNHDQPSRNALTGMNASHPNGKMAHAKTVLVLDADVLVRMSIVQLLRDCGYRVLEAASTDEAIAILQKPGIPVDVLLSEIDIPGSINGVGFAQWVGSVRPELKILFAVSPGRTVQNAAELCGTGASSGIAVMRHVWQQIQKYKIGYIKLQQSALSALP